MYKQAEKIKSNKKTEYILAFQKMSVYLQRSSYIQASEARYSVGIFYVCNAATYIAAI
nr:MAG TPA: hypothetical protein [Caudoviricetes sp.]